jgi:hypothetical protein
LSTRSVLRSPRSWWLSLPTSLKSKVFEDRHTRSNGVDIKPSAHNGRQPCYTIDLPAFGADFSFVRRASRTIHVHATTTTATKAMRT